MIPRKHWKYLVKARNLLFVVFSVYILATFIVPNDILQLGSKKDNKFSKKRDIRPVVPPSTVLKPGTRSNVIVNSYMRGGSSFVGRLFGFHPDSFYVYEPLWKYGIWDYFQKSGVCNAHSCQCRLSENAKKMVDTLISMNSCENIKDVVSPKMTDFYSGSLWKNFTMCYCKTPDPLQCKRRPRVAPQPCNDLVNKQCLQKRHTVSKVLRLTVDTFEELLEKTNDTKVIHLFRDPRATMNSRITTDWYPTKTEAEIRVHSLCLCKRMLKDYEIGLRLRASYPSRFKFVFYEDLVDDLGLKTNILYDFVQMRRIEMFGIDAFNDIANFGLKTDHSLRDNSTDYKSWWRKTMDLKVVRIIDSVCSEVYDRLGYRKFNSESDFRDLSQTSFSLQSQHSLY